MKAAAKRTVPGGDGIAIVRAAGGCAARRDAGCSAVIAMLVAALLSGCATTLERPVDPFQSKTIEVAPNAWYESCVRLEKGDRLLFSYTADPPMSLSIRRHIGDADVSYIVRDPAREDSGIFFVAESESYCLHWQPRIAADVTWPTLLRYSVRLNNSPAGISR